MNLLEGDEEFRQRLEKADPGDIKVKWVEVF